MYFIINKLARLLIHFRTVGTVLLCLTYQPLPALAEQVEAKLPSGIIAYAEFRQGSPHTAVLAVHGFLQTHHSQPMSSLASNLAAAGYTILSPTLSLGINRRKQSMACEAVHTHTIDDEVAEIAFWVDWLVNRGYKDIVPVGFSSTGNISLLQYNIQGSHPSIKKMILASINPVQINQEELKRAQAANLAKTAARVKKITPYSVGYCKMNFSASQRTYLSYANFVDDKVLDLISRATVPLEIILGSADQVLPADWSAKISARNARAQVSIIVKANHFFDGTTEIDLADKIESILKPSATH